MGDEGFEGGSVCFEGGRVRVRVRGLFVGRAARRRLGFEERMNRVRG
jgi:hypothetical protein